MTFVIIGVLVLLWVAFLAPTLLRARNNQVRADSVGDFHHRLRALAGSGGHRKHNSAGPSGQPILAPMATPPGAMTPAQRRRRDVLLILAGVAGVTFLAAVVTRSALVIAVQLLADAALAGYVYLLVQHKQRSQHQPTRASRSHADRVTAPGYTPYPSYGLADLDLRARSVTEPRLVPVPTSTSG